MIPSTARARPPSTGLVPPDCRESSFHRAHARLTASMPLFSRRGDPMLDQIARDTFALFPNCHRCGQRVARFEDADVRVLVQRIVHRGPCPVTAAPDDVLDDGDAAANASHAPT